MSRNKNAPCRPRDARERRALNHERSIYDVSVTQRRRHSFGIFANLLISISIGRHMSTVYAEEPQALLLRDAQSICVNPRKLFVKRIAGYLNAG